MRLKPLEEIVGLVTSVSDKSNHVELIFSMQKRIELPADAFSRKTLRNMIGEKIAIFNCNGNYRIREIENRDPGRDFVNLDKNLSSKESE